MPRKKRKSFKKFIILFIGILATVLVVDIGRYFIYPDIARLKRENPPVTAMIQYRETQWQAQHIKKKIRHTWASLRHISPYLLQAVVIAEDDKFWFHDGFDFQALQNALQSDVAAAQFKAGGSTITQQLAKNLYLNPDKNPIRKIKEAILTRRMEHTLSKGRILELYLNEVEWGDGIFGCETAAQVYFQKSALELTAEEAVKLASVLPNPKRFSPVLPSRFVNKRSRTIYDRMEKRGLID
ncbi:MAG: monofunctional biosynthetic peptidoglycan transglycosylase [Chitinivibrionales bacterium]|nr:monofunctional biosynthetic peptidoglycan transglycosylase [Chitinivibrionales bacterium]